MKDRFEKEIDEAVIDIDLENIQTNNSIFYIVSKRIIDIIGSLAGLIFLSPLFLIVAILIKLEDPKGKVFFLKKEMENIQVLLKCISLGVWYTMLRNF